MIHQQASLSIGVIIPAYNAEETLSSCLDALRVAGFQSDLVCVIDDCSTDKTVTVARSRGVEVVSNAKNVGAAAARNIGCQTISSDVLLFVDADVEVAADVKSRLVEFFENQENDAVFGSYDDAPARKEPISRLRNLLHHTTHQRAPGPVASFWTGLGAVRREVFEAAEGFDDNQSMLEDVEFGLRLTAMGYTVVLDPKIQGKHLKHWDLRSMFKTDFRDRAIPWTKLLMSPLGRNSAEMLNVSYSGKLSVVAAGVCSLAVLFFPFWPSLAICATIVGLGAIALLNFDFLLCVWRLDGWLQIPGAVAMLFVHFFAAGLGYLAVRLRLV